MLPCAPPHLLFPSRHRPSFLLCSPCVAVARPSSSPLPVVSPPPDLLLSPRRCWSVFSGHVFNVRFLLPPPNASPPPTVDAVRPITRLMWTPPHVDFVVAVSHWCRLTSTRPESINSFLWHPLHQLLRPTSDPWFPGKSITCVSTDRSNFHNLTKLGLMNLVCKVIN
jgi:hypothetical protein